MHFEQSQGLIPPVPLPAPEELAQEARQAPLFAAAVRLARWVGDGRRVGSDGMPDDGELLDAAVGLVLDDSRAAWEFAAAAELIAVTDDAVQGKGLARFDDGEPNGVLELWRVGLDAVLAGPGEPEHHGDDELDVPEWDERTELAYLDAILRHLHRITALEYWNAPERDTLVIVPLPLLAAVMVVPEGAEQLSDPVLAEIAEVVAGLEDRLALLATTGLVDYQPPTDSGVPYDADDLNCFYGAVRLTNLGVLAARERLVVAAGA